VSTTAPVVDARPHVAAIKAAIKTHFGRWDAYDYGEVPSPLPFIYALVSVDRRFIPARRTTAQAGRSSWRVTVRSVGRTADECRWAATKVAEALDEALLTVGGYGSTRLLHESSSDAEPDDGVFSALSSYTYTI
jgi:hypothetical protein